MIQLKQYKVIEVAGLDAQQFLQGQLTCDVTKLEIGKQTLTAHCDPKGKISGLWRLYRQSENQFLIIIHQDLLPEAIDQLKKYAIFSKVTFTGQQTFVYGFVKQQISSEISAKIYQNHTACQLEENSSRHIILSEQPLDATENSAYWDLLDIQNGIPILLKQNRLTFIPQALNLQDIGQAISFKKGCYIGQEIVARAKYRGANKRAMSTLVGTLSENASLPEVGSAVEMQLGENWKSTGTILYSLIADNQLWVQVVLNKDIEVDSVFRVNETHLSLFNN